MSEQEKEEKKTRRGGHGVGGSNDKPPSEQLSLSHSPSSPAKGAAWQGDTQTRGQRDDVGRKASSGEGRERLVGCQSDRSRRGEIAGDGAVIISL